MERNSARWLAGQEAFSLDVVVTTRTRDNAWRIDCFPVVLSAVQKLWALALLFTVVQGPLKTLPVYRESSHVLEFRDHLSLEGIFFFSHLRVSCAFSSLYGKSSPFAGKQCTTIRWVCIYPEFSLPPSINGLVKLAEKMRESIHQNAKTQSGTFPLLSGGGGGSHLCVSRLTAKSGNLRMRKEGLALKEMGENNAEAGCLRTPHILPGSPTRPSPTATLPVRRGFVYLDDAAAPRGRPCRLQEARLAVRWGPRGARQCDPAATVPHPAPRGRRHAVPGGIRAHSGVVFAPRRVRRRRILPAGRALGHGLARFGLPGRRRDARQRSPAARHWCAPAQGGGPARLCFTAQRRRWRRRWRQLSGEGTSLGQRRPRALV